jgi:hypothetical protein
MVFLYFLSRFQGYSFPPPSRLPISLNSPIFPHHTVRSTSALAPDQKTLSECSKPPKMSARSLNFETFIFSFFGAPFAFLGIFQASEGKGVGCLSEASCLPRRMSAGKIPFKKQPGAPFFRYISWVSKKGKGNLPINISAEKVPNLSRKTNLLPGRSTLTPAPCYFSSPPTRPLDFFISSSFPRPQSSARSLDYPNRGLTKPVNFAKIRWKHVGSAS